MRKTLTMNQGWRFHLGDIPVPPARGHDVTYCLSKAERARGAFARDYDDSTWEWVQLPHDYVVAGTPDPTENEDHALLARPNAWYRRTFILDPACEGQRIMLHFDGVVTDATVYLNGMPVARNHTGAIGFDINITDVARYGENVNTLAVYVNNENFEGWYYEGGGINRPVWITVTDPVAVDTDGVFIKSVPADQSDLAGMWFHTVETCVVNDARDAACATVVQRLCDPSGAQVATATGCVDVPGYSKADLTLQMDSATAVLWSCEDPQLYTLKTEIWVDGRMTDLLETACGMRTLTYDAQKGFFLNNVPTYMYGMSNHLDYAALGVAVPENVMAYRIQRLKDMGCNAYRCAHNPCPSAFYDLCDRMGMLVMDETRWFDSSVFGLDELGRMVKAHRNHPSVVMWSLNNEERNISLPLGKRMMARMRALTHQLDGTRPVTGAMLHDIASEGTGRDFDIIGINYNIANYDQMREAWPDRAFFGSETECTAQMWRENSTREYWFGTFPWTGWTYRGEAKWPNIVAYSGCIDFIGTPRDRYHMFKAWWSREPYCALDGHWNPAGPDVRTVTVYTNGDEVELFLNGASLGVKAVDPYEFCTYEVPYAPGELRAEVKKNGVPYCSDVQCTSGAAVALRLEPVTEALRANGEDIALVNVIAVDAQGNRVTDLCGIPVTFSALGGTLVGSASNDRGDLVPAPSPVRCLYNGMAQVMVRMPAVAQPVTVTAECSALGKAACCLAPEAADTSHDLAITDSRYIQMWKMSPPLFEDPDLESFNEKSDLSGYSLQEVGRGSAMACDIDRDFTMSFGNADDGFNVWLIYQADSRIPDFAPEGTYPVLHFDSTIGITWAKAICGGHTYRAYKSGYSPDSYVHPPMNIEMPYALSGQPVQIWIKFRSTQPFTGLHCPVQWQFWKEEHHD